MTMPTNRCAYNQISMLTLVMAEGSTPSRTRLYRMRVAANLNKIPDKLRVNGLLEGKWESFVANKPYTVLLVKPV